MTRQSVRYRPAEHRNGNEQHQDGERPLIVLFLRGHARLLFLQVADERVGPVELRLRRIDLLMVTMADRYGVVLSVQEVVLSADQHDPERGEQTEFRLADEHVRLR